MRREIEKSRYDLYDRYGNYLADRTGKEIILPVTAGEVINLALVQSGATRLTTDTIIWHRFFDQKKQELEPSASELLRNLSFDRTNPQIPWSQELNRLIRIMQYKETLIEMGTVRERFFFEIPETVKAEITEDLRWRYASYSPEINNMAIDIRAHLSIH